jgi:hypothetical protein
MVQEATKPLDVAAGSGGAKYTHAPVLAQSPARPSFAGKWRLDRFSGDMEALLSAMGMPWLVRKMAKQMNYGVGKQVQEINQDGDDFTVVTTGGPKVNVLRFRVGAEEKRAEGADGSQVLVKAWWDGERLVMTMAKEGRPPVLMSRYLTGQELVMEATTSTGEVSQRIFRREGASSTNAGAADAGFTVSRSGLSARARNPQEAAQSAQPLLEPQQEQPVAAAARLPPQVIPTARRRPRWCQCFRQAS